MTGSKLVGIVMGSDSDLAIMKQAVDVLQQFEIPYEVAIISAHRTPDRAVGYATSAEERGLEVIIAGAGGAAHLAGVIAALTPLPVIGVPIRSAALNGMDSLLSIVQMPPGVPVACVAIDGAKNAGILAAQIIATKRPDIREKIKQFKKDQAAAVEEKARIAGLGTQD
jgi:5-(carboxyamino)imidazole ribonucleotide mutase